MTEAKTPLRRVVMASLIGTTIEWYDFFLYGSAAALVFSRLFFPQYDPLTGTLLAFATYAVGFVARPVGGIVFGHYGDRIGRKRLLMLSLVLMGVATMLIGLLPTYAQIGIWAPVALIALRLVQGFAVGGEWGGAVLMAAEHGDAARRGFWASWPQAGVAAGNLLAAGVLALMESKMRYLPASLLFVALAACGPPARSNETDAPALSDSVEEADSQSANQVAAPHLASSGVTLIPLTRGDIENELSPGLGCTFSVRDDILLMLNTEDAIARANGILLHFPMRQEKALEMINNGGPLRSEDLVINVVPSSTIVSRGEESSGYRADLRVSQGSSEANFAGVWTCGA